MRIAIPYAGDDNDTFAALGGLHRGLLLQSASPQHTAHGARTCYDHRSAIEPDRHAGLDPGRIAQQVEAQPQRAAVVIADRPLRLPGRE